MIVCMDKTEFTAAGSKLYGEYGWKVRLAKHLDLSRNTITKYANGQLVIPKTVELAMRQLEAEK